MKILSIFLTGTLILSACSKTVKEIHQAPENKKNTKSIPVLDANIEIDAIKKLLASESPNIALAELLARTLPKEKKDDARKLIAALSAKEVAQILDKVKKQNENIRKDALFHGQRYEDASFISNTLKNDLSTNTISPEEQLRVSVFLYVKNKALDEILSAYNKKANELTNELSEDIAYEIAQNRSLTARLLKESKEASKEKVLKTIKDSQEFANKIDVYFKTSGLNTKEQYTTLLVGAIAGGVFIMVKDEASIRHLIEQGKKVIRDVNELKQKAEAAVLLVKTIGEHLEDTKTNIRDFTEGMRDSTNEIEQMYKNAKLSAENSGSVDSKSIADFLYNRVIKGKKVNVGGTNPSILSQGTKINESIGRSGVAAEKMGGNLSKIVASADTLTKLLKIGPKNDLHKVIKTASQVASVVSSVGSVMFGYATGGPFGAAMALSSSPMMSGLMGGGGSKDSAMLAEISAKLDEVIANQKVMMEMQVKTMDMIKEMAIMIDGYHQEEMIALSQLRDDVLVTSELGKVYLNSGIRSCEQIISFQLGDKFKNSIENASYAFSVNNVRLINTQFTSRVEDLVSIRNITKDESFEECRSGIKKAFAGGLFKENPLRAVFSSDEEHNLLRFERYTYRPLMASLAIFNPGVSLDTMPLHFPASDMNMLNEKVDYIRGQASPGFNKNEIYDIKNLISVKALERYLTSLIILYPMMELDKSDWESSYEDIVSAYWMGSQERNRGEDFLRNALKFTQSAIVQATLLAGEPLLANLLPYKKEILSSQNCEDEQTRIENLDTKDITFVCSVRSNQLLMENFVMFALDHQKVLFPDFMASYIKAYADKDLKTLAKLLNSSLTTANLQIVEKDSGMDILINMTGKDNKAVLPIKIPSPEALAVGKILYSENIAKLLLMQDVIIENLEKVTPVDRKSGQENLVNLLMVAN